MKARRGFTMIEVAIVLGLMALLLTPFLDLVVSVYRETQSLSVQADLMAEAERTANAVFRRAALGPYQLHPDNHGIRFADGSEVRFQDGTLRMGQQAALNPPPGVRTGGFRGAGNGSGSPRVAGHRRRAGTSARPFVSG